MILLDISKVFQCISVILLDISMILLGISKVLPSICVNHSFFVDHIVLPDFKTVRFFLLKF